VNRDVIIEDFAKQLPAQFAAELARGAPDEVVDVLAGLPPNLAIVVATVLPPSRFTAITAGESVRLREWLEAADVDTAIAFAARLPRDRCLELVNSLEDRSLQRQLLRVLRYPPHCVGAVVAGETIQVTGETAVVDLLDELRDLGRREETPMVVLDEQDRYQGKLDLWRLLLKGGSTGRAGEFVVSVAALRPETTILDARTANQWRGHHWLPVVDHDNRVLGSVTRGALDAYLAEAPEPLIDGVVNLTEELFRVSGNLLSGVFSGRGPM
jgi:Mg/Co/Ni transporter MgtE